MAFLAAVVPYLGYIAAGVAAVGAYQQADATKKAANFNAEVEMQNQQLAQREAQFNASQQQRETYQRLGAIRAAQGHSGGEGDQGSVLDVIGDTAAQAEIERQNIIYGGQLKSRGFANSAMLDIQAGKNAETSGYLKAGSALLGGGIDSYKYSTTLKRT